MRGTRNIISSEARTSLPHAAQMNDVEALPQMKLPSANDVMICINDVALCANGMITFAQCAEIKLIFNRKYDIIISRKAVVS